MVAVCARGARVASNSKQQQRQRARMWDRMKDAEECLIELAGDDGAELKAGQVWRWMHMWV